MAGGVDRVVSCVLAYGSDLVIVEMRWHLDGPRCDCGVGCRGCVAVGSLWWPALSSVGVSGCVWVGVSLGVPSFPPVTLELFPSRCLGTVWPAGPPWGREW